MTFLFGLLCVSVQGVGRPAEILPQIAPTQTLVDYDDHIGAKLRSELRRASEISAFLSRDPFEGIRTDPMTMHPYMYAHNDPINNVDPSGKLTIGNTVASLGIRLGIGGVAGAAIGAGDAFFGNRPVGSSAFRGAVFGAILGPFTAIQALQPVLFVAGSGLGGYSVGQAINDGDYDLAVFRGVLTASGIGAARYIRPKNPTTAEANQGAIVAETSVQRLVAQSTDDVLLGVVDKGKSFRLFKAESGKVDGHQDLLNLGLINRSESQGFSLMVSNGRVIAIRRNSLLNSPSDDFNLPMQTTREILQNLGAEAAKIIQN